MQIARIAAPAIVLALAGCNVRSQDADAARYQAARNAVADVVCAKDRMAIASGMGALLESGYRAETEEGDPADGLIDMAEAVTEKDCAERQRRTAKPKA